MKNTPHSASKLLTRRWRAQKRIPTAAFAFAALAKIFLAGAAAADEPPPAPPVVGPAEPVWPRELEALKQQLAADARARDQRIQAAEAELQKLRAQLDEERTKRHSFEEEARAAAADAKRAIDQSLVWRAGRFGLSLSGFIQADANLWRQSSQDEINPSTGAPLNDERFLIRRARLRAEVDYRWIAGALELDGNTVNGPLARIIGAEASFKWRNPSAPLQPYLMVTIGLFKTPFGFEVQQSDKERLFMERSNAERALFPGEYDLGLRVQGGWRFLRYQLAAMNGDPVGEKLFPGKDPNQSKDFVGRVGVDTKIIGPLKLAAGFSADYGNGFHKGTGATKDTLTWRDTNEDGAVQLNEIQVIRGQAASPSVSFGRYAVGGDLELSIAIPKLGELFLYGELVFATNLDRGTQIADPISATHDLRELGFYVAATQELTRYGQIGIRYDRYDPDRDANDLRGGVQVPRDSTFSTLAVAASLIYPGYGRLVLEYDHNTNPLGRLPDGTPTTLGDDSLILRGQVQF